MNISFFREFIVSVPTCDEADSLTTVWQRFRQFGTDQLIVVDQRQNPFGILKLCRLITVFSPLPAAPDSLVPNALLADCRLVDSGLIEPITVWTSEQIVELYIQLTLEPLAQSAEQIVVVDANGQYIGLLDRLRLMQQFLPRLAANQPRTISLPASAFPDPLVDLLERLPLPLMLQTTAGRVITQNLAWRQRVGAIQHPQQIRQAAAQVLEATLTCQTGTNPLPVEAQMGLSQAGFDQKLASDLEVANMATPQLTAVQATIQGSCQLGTEPNTCICVCPMEAGPDRVWQFIKVPMGRSTTSSAWESRQELGQLPSFKLASLKFNPDPDWRALIQTETLWLVLAQDMTEQQQVAKELTAKNADLLQLNRLKDEFLACISHELKTPLTAVLGMSSLLKDQLLGNLNERQAHYAQLIYRSGRHLVAIVNDILDLARIETGQLELLPEQIHISTLCQQSYEQAHQQHLIETNSDSELTVEPELQFQLQIQPELQYIVADELRLKQMLVNLLSNAIKFTEPGGSIGLQVEAWEGWIAFTVWDTGIGIPVEKQHLVFQKFQQLEHPLTRQFRGTGLGLVLTQRLARLHGGDISFTSVAGQGSRFTLLLPPVPPQSRVNFADLPIYATAHNRLVLLVEADGERLEQRLEQLTQLGYRAVVARSGTEAIEKARRLQPQVILLNPLLPSLSGWDVLTLLKADAATRNIPIVVMAVRVEKDQAYQQGAEGFLNLPVKTYALQRCLERFIRQSEPEPQPAANLTVLHLHDGSPMLTLLSNQHYCRVLEVDDLEQADLLAKVWHPDVVLIDQIQAEPQTFVQQLSQTNSLATLPLITLTAELTQAANQIAKLSVFPYLPSATAPNMTELMQIMQMAVGARRLPRVLIVDCAAVEFFLDIAAAPAIRPPVRALAQYLQTAGFHSSVETNWRSVQQQLQHQGVDLLLFCVSFTEPAAAVAQIVQFLQQLPQPILVWNCEPTETVHTACALEAMSQWQAVATQILPSSRSVVELLAQINQLLVERHATPAD
jgi:signal transduction histidine kinase/CheY-like chemotaxis protein